MSGLRKLMAGRVIRLEDETEGGDEGNARMLVYSTSELSTSAEVEENRKIRGLEGGRCYSLFSFYSGETELAKWLWLCVSARFENHIFRADVKLLDHTNTRSQHHFRIPPVRLSSKYSSLSSEISIRRPIFRSAHRIFVFFLKKRRRSGVEYLIAKRKFELIHFEIRILKYPNF